MRSTTSGQEARQLTQKGRATRARILEHAASLIYAKGVHATNNEELRRAAGVSGSQLNHYFPTKESLVLAVIEWQADRVLTLLRGEQFDAFHSIDGFRRWADFYVSAERSSRAGCSLGSLASEIIKSDLDVHDQLAEVFDQWRSIFSEGIRSMQRSGRLSERAEPEQLAALILAAFQGGMLLAQVARDPAPLRDALAGAIDHLESFSTDS